MTVDLSPYPEYKDSGVPWLNAIPSHWTILRAKNVFNIIDIRSKTGNEERLTVSSSDGVRLRSAKKITMFQAASYIGHKLCWPGDLAINSLWAWQTGLGFSKYHGLISSAYSVYRPKVEFSEHWQFFDYLLRSVPYNWEFRVRSKGVWTSRLQLLDSEFMDMPILIPPPDEQAATVRFLDAAEARIRRYIRAKQKLIKLLNEQKQAIIQQAVTRGLNPDVPMKDSGIAWLGEIPAHWEVRRAKDLCLNIIDCKNRTPPIIEGGSYTIVRTSNVRNGKLILKDAVTTDYENYLIWTQRGAPKQGDVFFTREAPTGEACLVPTNDNLCMGQRLMYFRPNPALLNERFLLLQIYGPVGRRYIDIAQNGSTVGHLRVGQVTGFPLLWCPIEEQLSIVEEIELSVEPLDKVISKAEKEIGHIREYRTRLIADVVTGKVDVRGLVFEMPEAFDEGNLLDVDEDEVLEGDDVLEEMSDDEV